MLCTKNALRVAIAAIALAAPASAMAEQHGPDPTLSSLRSTTGPYTVKKSGIADASTPGFGAATIYSPANPIAGEKYGVIAVAPGFTEAQSAISWYGPRFASQGFIVITFDTTTIFDFPPARANQLLAALKYVTDTSAVKTIADPNARAVMGHSMGGGATLDAAKKDPTLKATVGLTPWNQVGSWPTITTPSLVIAAENDIIAPIDFHAKPFYAGFSATLPKAYLELNNADHFTPLRSNTAIATIGIAWMKRFLDGDDRYTQFIKPLPVGPPTGSIQAWKQANL